MRCRQSCIPGNFPLVKERHQFALREGSEVGLDPFDKLRDAGLARCRGVSS